MTVQVLSVFEGSTDLRAAREVAGASITTMAALADRSLVQARDGRFSLHPLLRQYARQSVQERMPDLPRRHAEHYLARIGELAEDLSFGSQKDASDWIASDQTNIIAAWRWALAADRLRPNRSLGSPAVSVRADPFALGNPEGTV